MRNRMTLAASSVVVLVVAASSLSVQPGSAQTAKAKAKADECQSRPGASTPRGSHWYYRFERPSGRRCWYLGDANQKRQVVPTERAERGAPVERRATSVPPPPPRTSRLRADEEAEVPANATAARDVDANASASNAAAVTTSQFSAGWPAVPNAAAAPNGTATANDGDVTPAVADNTDAVATADASPEDMPMVWPALTTGERTTSAQAGEPPAGLGQLLIFLAATVAFVAIAVRAILGLFSPSRKRSRRMTPAAPVVVRTAAPIIRPRAPGRPGPENLDHDTHAGATEPRTASAVDRLREVAKRWETPAQMPRQPRIRAYEVMSDYEDQTPPVRRRAVA